MEANAVASTSAYTYQGKDAAAKEREDRLLAAKKKVSLSDCRMMSDFPKQRADILLAEQLKLYRARTNQRMSAASTLCGSGSSPSSSPIKAARRQSGAFGSMSMPADIAAAKHAHRRSQSKSGLLAAMGGDTLVGGAGTHSRRASKSRMSRNSISFKKAGHGHTRSRASISMSFSGPAPPVSLSEPGERPITPTPRAAPSDRPAALNTPSSWLHGGANGSPSTPDSTSRTFTTTAFAASPVPAPSPLVGAPQRHGRHGSRHTRQSSVANLRESIDMISGGALADVATLRPSVSSFAEVTPSPAASPFVGTAGWHNDPQQLLAALKERGRRETDDPTRSPEQTRQSALEALEGRLAAPTEMISLGDAEPGEMLSAARSPGKLHAAGNSTSAPHTPAIGSVASPMLGLGMVAGSGGAASKRSSWGPIIGHPPSATVAQGVMELGEIAEEDEEDEEVRSLRGSVHGDSPRRRASRARSGTGGSSPRSSVSSISRAKAGSPSPRKSRPLSLLLDSSPTKQLQLGAVAEEESSRDESFADEAQPSPASSRRSSMRPLSLSGFSRPASPSMSRPSADRAPSTSPDIRTANSPGEKRHVSMFHSAAVSGLNPEPIASPASSQSALAASQQQQRGGLRSLSMGSPTITPERRFSGRPASFVGTGISAASPLSKTSPSPTAKRSSISYRTDQSTPEGQQRAWRRSLAQHSTNSSISPAVSTKTYSSFPFGVSGGFGDLEVDGDDRDGPWGPPESPSRANETSASGEPVGPAAFEATEEELADLRNKLADLELQNSQLAATHAAEVAELERKASDAAGEMRVRISELEQQLEAECSGRRFEVEALQREVEMTKETIEDLSGERDALHEDVEGWRSRCNRLEAQVKKEREDDALAQAQAKLIGEMRDQIYTLVAALERERGEHAETRKEVERVLEDRVREAAADVTHQHNSGASLGSVSVGSTSSQYQTFKYASPPPGAPASLRQPRPDELALVMEMEEGDDEEEEAVAAPADTQPTTPDDPLLSTGRHGAMTASNGSLLSTLSSSYGQSYSGNTTEDTSLTTDVEDSYSNKYSSPPSGTPSYANSPFPPSARGRDSDVVAVALGQLDTLAEEEEEDVDASATFEASLSAASQTTPIANNPAVARDSLESGLSSSNSSEVQPTTPDRPAPAERHHRSRSFVRQWSVSADALAPPRCFA